MPDPGFVIQILQITQQPLQWAIPMDTLATVADTFRLMEYGMFFSLTKTQTV